jgi:hypothetical protein
LYLARKVNRATALNRLDAICRNEHPTGQDGNITAGFAVMKFDAVHIFRLGVGTDGCGGDYRAAVDFSTD